MIAPIFRDRQRTRRQGPGRCVLAISRQMDSRTMLGQNGRYIFPYTRDSVRRSPFFLLALILLTGTVLADEVQLAVAANFASPAKLIAAGFEKESGHRVLISAAGSGKLYAQIANGAPFAVLLAADAETPARLEREGLAQPGSRFTYAIGKLALWSARPGVVDDRGEVLRRGEFKHLALANPKLAPYGAAAIEALTALGLQERLQAKFVLGENIAQTHQFVASGNAELGFVALSQIMSAGKPGEGSTWLVPAGLYTPLRQDAALLARGKDNKAARAFLDYLRSDKAKADIRGFGYDLP